MFERIVVPLDGSAVSEQVLPLVQAIAKPLKSSVELLTVIAPGTAQDPRLGPEHIFRDSLTRIASALQATGIKTTFKVVEGDAAERILAEAERKPEALIAMSTHGRSGPSRWIMGSVADRVAHYATCPVLIVRPQGPTLTNTAIPLKTAIVPLDGSPLAEQALPAARQLAKALSLRMVLLRAVSIPVLYWDPGYAVGAADFYEQALEAGQQEAKAYVDTVAAAQRSAGMAEVTPLATVGAAAAVILDTATAMPGSITVMTSHGRSGVGRWLLGSVADHVIRHSDSPVLLVRAAPGKTA